MQTASRSCLESRDGWRVSSSSATRSLVTMTLSCEAVPGEDRATGGCCVQVSARRVTGPIPGLGGDLVAARVHHCRTEGPGCKVLLPALWPGPFGWLPLACRDEITGLQPLPDLGSGPWARAEPDGLPRFRVGPADASCLLCHAERRLVGTVALVGRRIRSLGRRPPRVQRPVRPR